MKNLNNSFIEITEIKSTHNQNNNVSNELLKSFTSVENLVENFRKNSKFVKELEVMPNVSSFQHRKNVFFDRIWNEVTNKARGIHVDTLNNKIIARGFDKFHGMTENMTLESYANECSYPLKGYEKLNGYLGLVGLYEDDFYIATKSHINSDFANEFRKYFYKMHTENQLNAMKQFIKDNNVTLVFEVILNHFDLHIIDYPKSRLVLLNAVLNTPKFSTLSWDKVTEFAKENNLDMAKLLKVFNNKEEFLSHVREVEYDFKESKTGIESKYNFEGYVLVDSLNNMTKYKFPYYLFWKAVRSNVFMLKAKLDKNPQLDYLSHIENLEVDNLTKKYIELIFKKYFDVVMADEFEIIKLILDLKNDKD